MSDVVGNPNCWFSHAKAHLKYLIKMPYQYINVSLKKI